MILVYKIIDAEVAANPTEFRKDFDSFAAVTFI